MRRYTRPVLAVMLASAGALSLHAATLQQMTMDDMIAKSTEIVRGKVIASSASFSGAISRKIIYTHYTVNVIERLKGSGGPQIDVAVPGGTAGGFRQSFAGAPVLGNSDEYVLFLWVSPSGLKQIIGLTQGLMTLKLGSSGEQVALRAPAVEPMVNSAGETVPDPGVAMKFSTLRARVATVNANPPGTSR